MLFSSRSQHEPAVVDVNCIHKYKEKFVILQSIGIIIIESRETRAVIYIQLHPSRSFKLNIACLICTHY